MGSYLPQAACGSSAFPAPRSVLIVEDDPQQADAMATRLTRLGYQPLHARTGDQGAALARSHQPHLVLLDLRLPDMTGIDFSRALQDDSDTRDIPVIALSGMQRPDIIRRRHETGYDYLLRKPCDLNVLATLIEQAIEERRRVDRRP